MLHNIVPEIIANQTGIPDAGGQKTLHPVGSGVAGPFRQLPAILAFHLTQQSPQIVQHPAARLRPPESRGYALVHLFNTLGPPGHLRHLINPDNHRLTSATLKLPQFYLLLICGCSTSDIDQQ